jgi:potassium-transporting ATPase KdpC subunit
MLRQLRPAVLSVLAMTLLFGGVYPLVVTGLARAAFPQQANGSLVEKDDRVIGSRLIGQSFTGARYFHPRPSAAGSGYDGANSGGTNLGPTSAKLINGLHRKLPNGQDAPGNFDGIKDLAAAYRKENGLAPEAPLPADAATRSASGLDPDVSVANARLQAARIARARGVGEEEVQRMVAQYIEPRTLGFLGEPRVNVLSLNLALDRETKADGRRQAP